MGGDIYKKIWDLSPRVKIPEVYAELTKLTRQLIQIYDLQGRLNRNPLDATRERKLSLPVDKLQNELQGAVCLITGGKGCVGSSLVKELLNFPVEKIVVVDIKDESPTQGDPRIIFRQCDIRDENLLNTIYKEYQPEFVFHTAAQRNPGYAEKHIYETITTNVLGTLNVVKASEKTASVKQCVFSSTGKASRYFTEEVYAGTKKMCEYIFEVCAKKSSKKYSFVRFTHILDNSLMNEELKHCSKTDPYLAIHSPGKYVTAQNVTEAAYLMLNALVYSEKKKCNFLLVRNLAWPVESLEMALYYIKTSGRDIPVIFAGNPQGYTEKFFRGQLNWSEPHDLNLLINVYESKMKRINKEDDIIITNICGFRPSVLQEAISKIAAEKGERELKTALIEGLKMIVRGSLEEVDKCDTINILSWGLQPKYLAIENAQISDYGAVVPLLTESLKNSEQHYNLVLGLICSQTPTFNVQQAI